MSCDASFSYTMALAARTLESGIFSSIRPPFSRSNQETTAAEDQSLGSQGVVDE